MKNLLKLFLSNWERAKKSKVSVGYPKDYSYRPSGGIFLISLANTACALSRIQRCVSLQDAGKFERLLLFFQFLTGRIGRETKPPPQFGQTLCSILSTQSEQNVHSKLHILASVD